MWFPPCDLTDETVKQAVLSPFLLHRIARTDRLIDFIVYRLYGLTEEEVAVVGGQRLE